MCRLTWFCPQTPTCEPHPLLPATRSKREAFDSQRGAAVLRHAPLVLVNLSTLEVGGDLKLRPVSVKPTGGSPDFQLPCGNGDLKMKTRYTKEQLIKSIEAYEAGTRVTRRALWGVQCPRWIRDAQYQQHPRSIRVSKAQDWECAAVSPQYPLVRLYSA